MSSIVAADSSSNPEAVGDAGLLFRAGDEAALAGALTRLCSEPGLRGTLGEQARSRVLEQFPPGGFLAETRTVYQEARRAFTGPDRVAGGRPS